MTSLARGWRGTLLLSATLAVLGAGSVARAEQVPPLNEWSVGVRGGISSSPDQTLVGAHYLSPSFFGHHIQLYPSAGLGFGEDIKTLRANADARYLIPVPETDWTVYFGSGLGWAHYSVTGPGDHSETGANGFIGGEYRFAGGARFFGEVRVPLGEIPGPSLIFKEDTLPKSEVLVGITLH